MYVWAHEKAGTMKPISVRVSLSEMLDPCEWYVVGFIGAVALHPAPLPPLALPPSELLQLKMLGTCCMVQHEHVGIDVSTQIRQQDLKMQCPPP